MPKNTPQEQVERPQRPVSEFSSLNIDARTMFAYVIGNADAIAAVEGWKWQPICDVYDGPIVETEAGAFA